VGVDDLMAGDVVMIPSLSVRLIAPPQQRLREVIDLDFEVRKLDFTGVGCGETLRE
jgi:hypothetical protein